MERGKFKAVIGRVGLLCVAFTFFLVLVTAGAGSAQDSKKVLLERIDAIKEELIKMNDWLYQNPESGHKEAKAVELLTGYLKGKGWNVEVGVDKIAPYWEPILEKAWKLKSLPTAFKATFPGQEGGPTIAFLVEYDALRGPGGKAFHGCQHNMQGPIGIGAAVALSEVMKEFKIPGRIVVWGTPAEEIPPPVKAIMFDSGCFKDVDVAIMFHGIDKTSRNNPGPSGMALDALEFVYQGKASHASSAPWEGKSALDAVILMYNAIDALREHSDPGTRMHGVITDGGAAPNIVPERAATVWFIRHFKRSYVDMQVERVKDIVKGAALMTGTTVKIEGQGRYDNSISVDTLEKIAFQYAKEFGAPDPVEPDPCPPTTGASTDFGTVSYNIPSITVQVKSAPTGCPYHSIQMEEATVSDLGHKALVIATKVEAALALDLLTKPNLIDQVKKEHVELRAK
jgi:amidohydrolase